MVGRSGCPPRHYPPGGRHRQKTDPPKIPTKSVPLKKAPIYIGSALPQGQKAQQKPHASKIMHFASTKDTAAGKKHAKWNIEKNRRLRRNVTERDDPFRLEHDVGGDVASDDGFLGNTRPATKT